MHDTLVHTHNDSVSDTDRLLGSNTCTFRQTLFNNYVFGTTNVFEFFKACFRILTTQNKQDTVCKITTTKYKKVVIQFQICTVLTEVK